MLLRKPTAWGNPFLGSSGRGVQELLFYMALEYLGLDLLLLGKSQIDSGRNPLVHAAIGHEA